jgi:hypothetical protein
VVDLTGTMPLIPSIPKPPSRVLPTTTELRKYLTFFIDFISTFD